MCSIDLYASLRLIRYQQKSLPCNKNLLDISQLTLNCAYLIVDTGVIINKRSELKLQSHSSKFIVKEGGYGTLI